MSDEILQCALRMPKTVTCIDGDLGMTGGYPTIYHGSFCVLER